MAQMTVIAIAIDFANVAHAQAFAQIAALAAQNGMALQVGVGASAPAPATAVAQPTAEVKAPKTYAPTEDTLVRLVVDKTLVKAVTLDGKFIGASGVRKVVNARIREAGGAWDAEHKAYKFTKSAKAIAFAEQETLNAVGVKGESVVTAECPYVALVTAEQWQAQRDRAVARAEKKA